MLARRRFGHAGIGDWLYWIGDGISPRKPIEPLEKAGDLNPRKEPSRRSSGTRRSG
jgi:hypothetical protein